jgi:hypothetical protein
VKRVLVLAMCAAFPLCLVSNASAGVNFEALSLNSYEAPSDGAAGPESTSKPLDSGALYGIVASGTFSYYQQQLWTNPPTPFVVCGQPEPAPQRPSPGRPSGPVGNDVETIFALPYPFGPGSCTGLPMPQHWTNFEMDLGSGYQHVEPVSGAQTAPNRWHAYLYLVRGAGQPARFQLRDSSTTDNYGVETIVVKRLSGDDCKKNEWEQFDRFRNQGDCVSYFATNGRNEPGGP